MPTGTRLRDLLQFAEAQHHTLAARVDDIEARHHPYGGEDANDHPCTTGQRARRARSTTVATRWRLAA